MPLPKQGTLRQYSFQATPRMPLLTSCQWGRGLIRIDGNSTTGKFVDEDSSYRQSFEADVEAVIGMIASSYKKRFDIINIYLKKAKRAEA